MMRALGSSPRVRGAADYWYLACPIPGVIPACAGSRLSLSLPNSIYRDHPRVCGEQSACATGGPWSAGSSPRVRGAAEAEVEYPDHGGIIPACAGSSSLRNRSRRHIRDHPRVCGEQPPTAPRKGQRMGSSPRVRGAALPLRLRVCSLGIIPACAGSSRRCPTS